MSDYFTGPLKGKCLGVFLLYWTKCKFHWSEIPSTKKINCHFILKCSLVAITFYAVLDPMKWSDFEKGKHLRCSDQSFKYHQKPEKPLAPNTMK